MTLRTFKCVTSDGFSIFVDAEDKEIAVLTLLANGVISERQAEKIQVSATA